MFLRNDNWVCFFLLTYEALSGQSRSFIDNLFDVVKTGMKWLNPSTFKKEGESCLCGHAFCGVLCGPGLDCQGTSQDLIVRRCVKDVSKDAQDPSKTLTGLGKVVMMG